MRRLNDMSEGVLALIILLGVLGLGIWAVYITVFE